MADKQQVAQHGILSDATSGSGISEAASAWEEALSDDYPDEERNDQAGDGEEPIEDDGQEGQEPESDEDEFDEGEDDEEDGEDDDGEDDEEDEPDAKPAEIDPTTKVKVKVDGEEKEVTFDELRNGYSRTEDYTRKTQALAEQRQQLTSQEQQVLQQQQQWSQALGTLQQRLEAGISGKTEAEWQQLKQTDEIAYYEEREKERATQDRLSAIQQEQQRVQQEQQQFQQRQYQEVAQQEKAKLLEKVPEWSDPAVFAKESTQLKKYGQELGYTEQELNSIVDHRALAVLREAAKYRELMATRKSGTKPTKTRTKPLKPGTPQQQSSGKVKRRKASQNLAKRQSVDAATDYFLTLDD